MKRTTLTLLLMILLLTACGIGRTPVPTPEHDNLQTVVAETLTAQPTWTPLPTNTPVPIPATPTQRPTRTITPTSVPSATVLVTPGLAVTPQSGSLLPGMPIEGIGCFPANAPQDLAAVLRVDSGDTIQVLLNGVVTIVRYIGIQAPSLKVKPPAPMSTEAFQKNKALVDGKVVVLVKDTLDKDASGALLRYVVSTDGVFVNYNLVRNGFAISLRTPPNLACQQTFDEAQAKASQARLGLWRATSTLPPGVTRVAPTSVH